MDKETVSTAEFVSFVKGLHGQELLSRAGRAKFSVEVNDKEFIFTPASTGKPRHHTMPFVERVLEQFNSTNSFVTSEYKFTINATYQLGLISLYLKKQGKIG